MFRPVCSHVPALAFSVASLQVLPVFQLLTGGVSPALEQNTNQTLHSSREYFSIKCFYLSGRLLGLLLFFLSLPFFLDHKNKIIYLYMKWQQSCMSTFFERKRAGNWVLIGARDLGIVLGWTAKQRWRPPRVGKKTTITTTTKKPKSHAIKNGY